MSQEIEISNLSPLDGLRENIKLVWHGNPAFPTEAPKIEGPWLWVVLPDTVGDHLVDTDLLSEASGGAVTEVEVSTHGATAGGSVGNSVWTSHRLPPTGQDNITRYAETRNPLCNYLRLCIPVFTTGAGDNDVCGWRPRGKGLAQRGL